MCARIKLLLVSAAVIATLNSVLSAQPGSTRFETGKPFEGRLAGGEVQTLRVHLEANQFLHVVVNQRGIDVVVSVIDPGGKKVFEVDSPNGTDGPETVRIISSTEGDYRVEIGSLEKSAAAGSYDVRIIELRQAVANDQIFVNAENAIAAGSLLVSDPARSNRLKGIEKFKEAVLLYRELDDQDTATADLITRVGERFYEENELEEGISYFRELVPLFSDDHRRRSRLSALMQLGRLLKENTEYDKALDALREVQKIAAEIGDRTSATRVFNNMGNVYEDAHKLEHALDAYQQCLSMATELHLDRIAAAALNNLGNVYGDLGNFGLAVDYQRKQIEIGEKLGDKGIINRALVNLGLARMGQREYAAAVEVYKSALKMAEELGNKRGAWYAHNNIGLSYERLGNYKLALEHEVRALELGKELNQNTATIQINIAIMQLNLGDTEGATRQLREVLETSKDWENKSTYTEASLVLAGTYCKTRSYLTCVEMSKEAQDFARHSGDAKRVWRSLSTMSKGQVALNQPIEARKSLEEAISIIEKQQKLVEGGPDEQRRYFTDKTEPYYALTELLSNQNDPVGAIGISERIKARMLLDILRNGRTPINKAMSPGETAKEQSLRAELIAIRGKLSNEEDNSRGEALRKQLEAKRSEYDDFRTKLYSVNPLLKVRRGDIEPISVDKAVMLLPDEHSAALEFSNADDRTQLFVLSLNGSKPIIKSYSIEIKGKELGSLIDEFRTSIETGDLGFSEKSRNLYSLLIKPAATQLIGKNNLIIVPDDVLWNLPFQALQTLDGKYLAETTAISYAPSLTALWEMRKRSTDLKAERTLLAFGNPVVDKETSKSLKRVFMSEKLEPLPEAERLVNSLQSMYGAARSKVYTGADAREETAKAEVSRFRILQFATHGTLNDASPMYSHIVLARKENNPNEDGLLEAWEMKDLDLNADLVILSACDTARGKVSSGEGMIGMTWALFIAGTPTTVASQWKVESSSTTELMLEFHRQLLTGKVSKAEALRRAELKVMKMPRYRHPAYWAGFVVVGDGG